MTPDRSPATTASDDALSMLDAESLASVLDSMQTSPTTQDSEHRSTKRYLARWRVAAFIDQRGLHHGRLKDISVTGTAVLFDQNFQSVDIIKLHIYVPPPATSRMPCIIEVIGKVVYTIFDSHEQRFRTGVNFLQFSTAQDPVFLAHHLANHALTAMF